MTEVGSVTLLLAGKMSVVWVETVAVLLIVDVSGMFALTCTTSVKVALVPPASVPMVAEKVPVPPTAGLDRVNAGPESCVADTKFVFAGIASDSATVCASLRLGLDTVMV